MTKLVLGALGLALLCSLGCLHLQPVGPITNPSGRAPADEPPAKVKVTETQDVARMPTVQPLPPPTPPAVFVTPGEVTEANYKEKVRRLLDEMEADRQVMEAMPRASEVSVIRK